MKALHGAGDRDVEEAPFLSLRISSAHAHGLQYVWVLHLGREAEKVIAGVGDDDDVGLQSLRPMRRQDANSLHVPIRVPHRNSIPSAGLVDILQQVIGSAQDEDTVCRNLAKLLADERRRAIHDRRVVIGHFMYIRLALLATGDDDLFWHLLLIACNERGARLYDNRGR